MKSIQTHINERLKLTANTARSAKLRYFPKNNIELCNIVSDIIVEHKNKSDIDTVIDLNCIDTSKVADMSMVFVGPDPVNIDISEWNTSRVKTFELMFGYCTELKSVGDLSQWDVSNAKTMKQMFFDCQKLTELHGLDTWKTDNLEYTNEMFYNCRNLEEIEDLSDFNMSNIKSISGMFQNCVKLKHIGDLSKWKISPYVKKTSIFSGTHLATPTNWN